MLLAHPARRLPHGVWLGLAACLSACSLQMPSEGEVFGSAGAQPVGAAGSAASADAQGGSATLGDGGSNDGVTESAGRGGVPNLGTSGSSGSSELDPNTDLVAHFTFDEPSGAVIANAKDSTKNAKCVGTCTRPSGQLGLAVGIRNNVGPSAWIELPAGIFAGHSAITLSVWLRDLSTTRSEAPLFHFGSGLKEALYFTPDDRSSQNSGAHLAGVHAGTSFVELWSGRPDLTDKAWHQVVVSWSSANIKLYIDGDRVGNNQSPSLLPSQLGSSSTNYLGRGPDDASPAFFGEIDDLRVYDRALSATQIALLYKLR